MPDLESGIKVPFGFYCIQNKMTISYRAVVQLSQQQQTDNEINRNEKKNWNGCCC